MRRNSGVWLERITLCEHGHSNPHRIGTPLFDDDGAIIRENLCHGAVRREVTLDIQQAIRTFDDEYGNGEPEEWMTRVVEAALTRGDTREDD